MMRIIFIKEIKLIFSKREVEVIGILAILCGAESNTPSISWLNENKTN